jgi:Asp-tRNA(Asn)/Glu-tRNA(Gln) amidotransferase A subunit family amidase
MSSSALSLTEAAADIREGRITSAELVADCLQRIAEVDPKIEAWAHIDRDHAMMQAEAADLHRQKGNALGPLHGVPLGIKDIFDTGDYPTEFGSPAWAGRTPRRDATAVARLRAAGAVIMGKTVTTEYAYFQPGKTRNPHDPSRTPGGSSSGSAAAVGAGMVPAGLGTQVVGSILRPASFCGTIGFKPSIGAINRSGSHDHFSQSVQGAIGATLADIWALLRAIADRAGGDPGFAGLSGDVDFAARKKPARIGVLQTGGWGATTEGARQAFDAAKRKLAVGVELRGRGDDPDIEAAEAAMADALPVTLAINAWEGRWPLNTYADMGSQKLSAPARERLKTAEAMTQREYGELIARRDTIRAVYDKAASRYDAFITLGACGAAPVGLGTTGNTIMNVAASLLGCPALTLPLLSDENLPLGLQLLGRTKSDAALFEAAGWVAGTAFARGDLVGTAAG